MLLKRRVDKSKINYSNQTPVQVNGPYVCYSTGVCTNNMVVFQGLLQVAILCGHHQLSVEISSFSSSDIGEYIVKLVECRLPAGQ